MKRAISQAKTQYKNKIEQKFQQGNYRAPWQGIYMSLCLHGHSKDNDDRRQMSVEAFSDSFLPNEFNRFYNRFERPDQASEMVELKHSLMPTATLILQKQDVPNQQGCWT